MEPADLTLESFEASVQQQEKPAVIVFEATWSVACTMYKDKVLEANDLCQNEAIFGFADIDAVPELTERFSIITIPTTLIFYKEQIVKQYMGIQEPKTIQEAVYSIIGKPLPVQEPEQPADVEPL